MGCPPTPLSCLSPSDIFAGVYNPNCGGFADPSNFQAEQAIYKSGFGELINNYGVEIGYYVNSFNLSAMNAVYGEHTTEDWHGPTTIKAYPEMETPAAIYSLAGFDAADTLTLYIHIDTFTSSFSALSVFPANGIPIEPKPHDKIAMYPFGCDRVNGRGVKIFEITYATDEDLEDINPMMGHYVWKIKAVRSEFNSTTNEPRENVNNQAADNTFFGKLSSSLYPELTGADKLYPSNSDDTVIDQVFPHTRRNNDSVYGEYF